MPKLGMTALCLKDEVAQLIRKRAKENNQGLNEFLSNLLLGPSLNQSGPSQPWSQDRPRAVGPTASEPSPSFKPTKQPKSN